MSKYGDDYTCTCEMELVSCKNSYHASTCDLWQDDNFRGGTDEWDGDLGTLVLAASPWETPEEWVWNGDEPVVRKSTYVQRQSTPDEIGAAVAEWEQVNTVKDAEWIGPLEQEVMDALTEGQASVDDVGLVELPDGSYADFELRVTYRKKNSDTGNPIWTEEFWDGEPTEAEKGATKVYDCDCTAPAKKFFCSVHNVQRDKETDPWRYWAGHATTGTTYSSGTSWTFGRCGHCFETFTLPGAQHENIKISAKRTHGVGNTPDFGLYAYAGWAPSCVATFIPWQDYGLPTVNYTTAAAAIVHAWELSCDGQVVEVGCMGGHGRTGTILACLALLSDNTMSSRQAIAHVRKVHCDEAIETNQQEWFIEWFRCWLLDEKCPPMPKTYVSKHSANWQAASTAAVAVKENAPTLPLASVNQPSPSGGSTGNVWCSGCKRLVHVVHNTDCAEYNNGVDPLRFDSIEVQGETANARRRNAKRANRRAAKKRQQAQRKENVMTIHKLNDILQEYT